MLVFHKVKSLGNGSGFSPILAVQINVHDLIYGLTIEQDPQHWVAEYKFKSIFFKHAQILVSQGEQ